LLEEALALFRKAGDQRAVAWVLDDLGNLARLRGDHDRARRLFKESLRMLRETQELWGIPWVLHDLANLARIEGDDDRARALLGRALRRFQALGEQRGIASGLSLAGVLAIRRGAHADGVQLIGAGLALHRRLGTAPPPDEQK
jgi:tetratricopeptide (TPR) repeat protein